MVNKCGVNFGQQLTKAERCVLAKAREQQMINFSEEETNRVYQGVIAPKYCKCLLKNLIIEQGLTIDKLYGYT